MVDGAEIHDEATLRDRRAGHTVRSRTYRDLEAVPFREGQRRHDIVGAEAVRDHRGAVVDVGVPDPSGVVVRGVSGTRDMTGEGAAQKV